jgi:hypothetical protein
MTIRETHMALPIRVAGITFSLMSTTLTTLAQDVPQPAPRFEQVYRMPRRMKCPAWTKRKFGPTSFAKV